MPLSPSPSPSPLPMSAQRDLRGTWPQALRSLSGAILLILGIRWAFFEPYVIPSGSMIPSLLIHDHILVNKMSYGIRVPFTSAWLIQFGVPSRGDVVVFRSVDDASVFVVKRVIGLPGDEVLVGDDGSLTINGQHVVRSKLNVEHVEDAIVDWPAEAREEYLERFDFYRETLGNKEHLTIKLKESGIRDHEPFKVPEGALFMMGDNRDNSSDSRVWGVLPLDRVLGRAFAIWLSCEETLPAANQLCDPQTMRWRRLFKGIQ